MVKLKPATKFRDFVEVLKKEHDLVEITQRVDPHLEVGAIMRKAYEERAAVPFFLNLKQNPANLDSKNLFNIVGCLGGLRKDPNEDHARIAHHLGLNPATLIKEIINHLNLDRKAIKPKLIEDQENVPCKQNKLTAGQIDLESLPAPFLHQEDGGKYLQTYGMFILQTPDKKWTNWSIARAMVYDKTHLTGLVINPQHIRKVANEWAAIGKGTSIPYALCFGVPPAAILVSSMPIPDGVSEADYIGGVIGEPLPVVKSELSDLEVPADSEMVFEGKLDLDANLMEGPFGEMHGYVFPGTGHPSPAYEVESITYRDDAVLPVSNPGLCTDETHTLIGGLVSARCSKLSQEHPILKRIVKDVFTPYEGQVLWLALLIDTKELLNLKTNSKELCTLVGDYFFPKKEASIIQEIVLVGDDIDVFNFRKFIWAYATRHTPGDDQYFFNDYPAFPLAPFIAQGPRNKTRKGGNCVTDCLLPKQYEDTDFKFVTCDFDSYDLLIKDSVNKNWKAYGFRE